MTDYQSYDQGRSPAKDGSGVDFFASQVVSLLADRSAKAPVEPR
jgi:hypothetical protein